MRIIFTFLLVASGFVALAQQFRAQIADVQSTQPLGRVLVKNLRSGALWISDSVGSVAFTAFPGDVVSFSLTGYREITEHVAGYDQRFNIRLERLPIQLSEVQVLSPYARFQRDSAFNRLFYRDALKMSKAQSKLDLTNGIGASGLVSDLAMAISGKKRYYKGFAANMAMLEDLRFSSIRYTPEAVAAQTGMSDSAAAQFILRNPMPAEIARNAGELEFKMWIRTAFRTETRRDSLRAVQRRD